MRFQCGTVWRNRRASRTRPRAHRRDRQHDARGDVLGHGAVHRRIRQHGADRAKYGSLLLSTLARDLTLKHGCGFNRNNLQYMRKLYRAFPICTTLSCKLSWSRYLEILKCSDELEIGLYVAECVRSNWNERELRRQMKSSSSLRRGLRRTPRRGVRIKRP